MTPRVLVITTVHHPDDTRIRDRLIETLRADLQVAYLCKSPGPTSSTDLEVSILEGGRASRWLRALGAMLRQDWEVAVIHDPELIPAGLLAKSLRRRPVVFDAHEDLEAQIETKTWIPTWAKPAARWMSRFLYRSADRFLLVTLAENGYQGLFRKSWPVFANYPRVEHWPVADSTGDAAAIYVGDVTAARGLFEAIEATGSAGIPLVVVGPVEDTLRTALERHAAHHDCELTLTGRQPNRDALRAISQSAVGLSPLRAEPNYQNSLPTKVLEYLCVGVPVVASDLPGTRAVVSENDSVVFFTPGDAESMSEALEIALSPDFRVQAKENSAAMRERYRWPADAVREFYGQLVNPGESPGPS